MKGGRSARGDRFGPGGLKPTRTTAAFRSSPGQFTEVPSLAAIQTAARFFSLPSFSRIARIDAQTNMHVCVCVCALRRNRYRRWRAEGFRGNLTLRFYRSPERRNRPRIVTPSLGFPHRDTEFHRPSLTDIVVNL